MMNNDLLKMSTLLLMLLNPLFVQHKFCFTMGNTIYYYWSLRFLVLHNPPTSQLIVLSDTPASQTNKHLPKISIHAAMLQLDTKIILLLLFIVKSLFCARRTGYTRCELFVCPLLWVTWPEPVARIVQLITLMKTSLSAAATCYN